MVNSECKVWRCKNWGMQNCWQTLPTLGKQWMQSLEMQNLGTKQDLIWFEDSSTGADALIEQHANHALCQRLGLMKDDLTSLGHSRASDQGACCQFSLSQLCSVLTMTRQAMQIADHALLQLGWADSKPVADPLDVCVVRWGRCRQGNGWTYGPLLPRSWAWGRTWCREKKKEKV
jgi:hypothetical protein